MIQLIEPLKLARKFKLETPAIFPRSTATADKYQTPVRESSSSRHP
ncbi:MULTISPECIES: hypothetical protein [unclassified Microcoleus]|nr:MULTISPECIES: hypothetical protein [unclassified Microcoleus]